MGIPAGGSAFRRAGGFGSGPRGSALGPGRTSSDGKPCSGVRGGQ